MSNIATLIIGNFQKQLDAGRRSDRPVVALCRRKSQGKTNLHVDFKGLSSVEAFSEYGAQLTKAARLISKCNALSVGGLGDSIVISLPGSHIILKEGVSAERVSATEISLVPKPDSSADLKQAYQEYLENFLNFSSAYLAQYEEGLADTGNEGPNFIRDHLTDYLNIYLELFSEGGCANEVNSFLAHTARAEEYAVNRSSFQKMRASIKDQLRIAGQKSGANKAWIEQLKTRDKQAVKMLENTEALSVKSIGSANTFLQTSTLKKELDNLYKIAGAEICNPVILSLDKRLFNVNAGVDVSRYQLPHNFVFVVSDFLERKSRIQKSIKTSIVEEKKSVEAYIKSLPESKQVNKRRAKRKYSELEASFQLMDRLQKINQTAIIGTKRLIVLPTAVEEISKKITPSVSIPASLSA